MRRVQQILRVLAGVALAWVWLTPSVRADSAVEGALERIRNEWAVVMFQVAPEKRSVALDTLAQMARGVAERYPGEAGPITWEGIVLASYADLRGPVFGYLAAQRARGLLQEAERRAPASLDGIGYGALASLYWNSLPWPLSFGDADTARTYLQKALATAPDTLEAQLLLTLLLLDQGDTRGASRSAHRALAAHGPSGLGDEIPPARRHELIRLLVATESRH